jgi:hypothetical protein
LPKYLDSKTVLIYRPHPVLIQTGKGGGETVEPERTLEGQQFTKLGRKYQHDLLYLKSINTNKTCRKVPLQRAESILLLDMYQKLGLDPLGFPVKKKTRLLAVSDHPSSPALGLNIKAQHNSTALQNPLSVAL